MHAVGDYIIVEDLKEDIKATSGMVLSDKDTNMLRYRMGKVKSVGNNVKAVAIDDTVYYDKGTSFSLILEGSPHTVTRISDIVVVL